MKISIHGKVLLASIVVIVISFLLYAKKIDNETDSRINAQPTQNQINNFYAESGIKNLSEKNIVSFSQKPDMEHPLYVASRDKTKSYDVVLRLDQEEERQFIGNQIFSSKRESGTKPLFSIKELPQADGKSYIWLSGSSPGIRGRNLTVTIDRHENFSYAYVELILPNN